jgi:hypothetical protein
MTINRGNRTAATEMVRITRSRGCATAAAPRRATTGRSSTGPGRVRPAAPGKPTAGSTTSNAVRVGSDRPPPPQARNSPHR